MNNQLLSVGIIGTGEMGKPVVNRLLSAGYSVTVYARRSETKAQLQRAGAYLADTISELAEKRDVVILYLFSDDQVRSVALDDGLLDAMAPGSTLVIHTTGSPATATELSDYASARNVGVIDAPGSGGPAQVAEGELNLFIGGSVDHYNRCKSLLESYASRLTYFGYTGSGQIVKLINNLLFGAHIQLALDSARIAESAGIDAKRLAETLHTCSGQSYSLDLLTTLGSAEELVRRAGPYIYKDATVAAQVAESMEIPLGSIDAVIHPLLKNMEPYKH